MSYIIPAMFLLVFLLGFVKKKNVYGAFVEGAKEAFPLSVMLFPYLATVVILVNALESCGVLSNFVSFLAPPFVAVGIPEEVLKLVLLRPFSGSGSIALLNEIYTVYGADGYVARCASVLMGSTETVFYVSAVYFAGTKVKRTGLALPIALACTLLSCVLTCLLCRIM